MRHLLLLLLAATLTGCGVPVSADDDDDSVRDDDDDTEGDDDDSMGDDDDSTGDDDDDDDSVGDDDDDDDSAGDDDDDDDSAGDDDDDDSAPCGVADLDYGVRIFDPALGTTGPWSIGDTLTVEGSITNPCSSAVPFTISNGCVVQRWDWEGPTDGGTEWPLCDEALTEYVLDAGGTIADSMEFVPEDGGGWTWSLHFEVEGVGTTVVAAAVSVEGDHRPCDVDRLSLDYSLDPTPPMAPFVPLTISTRLSHDCAGETLVVTSVGDGCAARSAQLIDGAGATAASGTPLCDAALTTWTLGPGDTVDDVIELPALDPGEYLLSVEWAVDGASGTASSDLTVLDPRP